ncbi:MAG TPA: hypothetical protein VMG36_04210 [Thermoplasmata archaeon]|nr:hypothetical protein [Thermoplasmata archaeon]
MKGIPLAGVVATFLALSGVAFACGYSGQCGSGHDSQGCSTPSGLEWVNPNSATPSAPGIGCTVSHSDSTLTIAVTGLSPGGSCAFAGTLENTGSSAVGLAAQITANQPHACRLFVYGDNLVGLLQPPSLAGGHTFAYSAKISLAAAAGNACEGAAATFVVTISGSQPSSPCDGFYYGLEFGPGDHNNCCH